MVSPSRSDFIIENWDRKETQKGFSEQAVIEQGQYSDREAEEKAAFSCLFLQY